MAASAALLLFLGGTAPAGPVPGVETFTKFPVDFPVPQHLAVWDISNNEYLVRFRWKPEQPVNNPAVAGSFNYWNRTDLPMEGPDEDGFYSVTARISAGDYEYKFTGNTNDWFVDPLNKERNPDGQGGDNAVLRLGITALLKDKKVARGDGDIEVRAFLHDPSQFTYYDPFTKNDVMIRFRTLAGDVDSVTLSLIDRDGKRTAVPMVMVGGDAIYDFHEHHYVLPAEGGAVGYEFSVTDGGKALPQARQYPIIIDPARMISVPDWSKNVIWYQVMIDRFRDGDAKNNPEHTAGTGRVTVTHPWKSGWDKEQAYEREGGQTMWQWAVFNRLYGGDFQGLIDKLDYIKGLGATGIYLNPVFEATNSHKYNAKSFVHADDGYGVAGEFAKSTAAEDLKDPATWEMNDSDKLLLKLIEECKKRDLRIIFDGVFNHLGDDSTPFLKAKEGGPNGPFADWFNITGWDPFEYRGWWGFGQLPEFKKTRTGFVDPTLRDHIFAVTKRWMDPNGDGDPSDGIDGWRLDVPGEVPKAFWVEWRKVVKETNPEAYIVGEKWEASEDWLQGDKFDATMHYELAKLAFTWFGNKDKKITASEFDRGLGRMRVRYSRATTMAQQVLFDSHDTDRWVNRLANPDRPYDSENRLQDEGSTYKAGRPDEEAYRRLRLMAIFQATYVGAPMIWYGTEVGMFGADDPACRMPMWWEDMMPYENPDYRIDDGLREHFRSLFKLRNEHAELRTGDVQTILADNDKDVLAYARFLPDSDKTIVVVLNNSGSEQTVRVGAAGSLPLSSGGRKPGQMAGFGKATIQAADGGGYDVTIPAVDGTVLLFAGRTVAQAP